MILIKERSNFSSALQELLIELGTYRVESSRHNQEKCSKNHSNNKYAIYKNTRGNDYFYWSVQLSSVQSLSSVWLLQLHELQHARPPCPSPTPEVYPNSCPSSWWCHPDISSSVIPFSSCPQSLPASESFPMSQLFTWGGQSTGVSALASFLPKNTQDWSPLEWTGWISLLSIKSLQRRGRLS